MTEISTPKLKRAFNKLWELRSKCKFNGERYKIDKQRAILRDELLRREKKIC